MRKRSQSAAEPIPSPRNGSSEPADSGSGLIRELIDFLVNNMLWWLTPILVVLLLIGFLILRSGSGAGPFIYPER